MKQIVQNFRSGELSLIDVPAPMVQPGFVLVHNRYSLISAGTERTMVDLGQKSLLGKARQRPDLVRKVINKAVREGVVTAFEVAMQKLDTLRPLGYSCAGEVLAVGAGVQGLRVGERVACAGAGYASHAEVVSVPKNLCVAVPESLDLRLAAFTTVGAIALEGVRVADVRLGDRVLVIGLGLVGLLTTQILKAAGCRVLGLDVSQQRVDIAGKLGADLAVVRSTPNLEEQVAAFTDGYGADAVIITAATDSTDPVEVAGLLARQRAIVTVVGVVNMTLPHKLYYEKGLDLRMSRSYGPGRYDRNYEELGHDYPLAYVRWTEHRNMAAFITLLAQKQIDVTPLITHEFAIDQALSAYDLITGVTKEPHVGVLLRYPADQSTTRLIETHKAPTEGVENRATDREGAVLSLIGAGNFATSTLLPALAKVDGVTLRGVATAKGMSARKVADKYGFALCASDYRELLADPQTRGVLIATNNAAHASITVDALRAGKTVFVEKPLATNIDDLRAVYRAYYESGCEVMVGFNRRYAPLTAPLRSFFQGRRQPMVATFRVNAGSLEPSSWVQDPAEGAGRLIAESCHFIDYLQHIIGSPLSTVFAQSIASQDSSLSPSENVVITLSFADGSLGTVIYVANGDTSFSKERLECFAEGGVAVLTDFRELELVRGGRRHVHRQRFATDKGHVAEMAAVAKLVAGTSQAGANFDEYVAVTLATFAAWRSIQTGKVQTIDFAALDVEPDIRTQP